jgi:N-sulfoglucosamine sulfohydrolase
MELLVMRLTKVIDYCQAYLKDLCVISGILFAPVLLFPFAGKQDSIPEQARETVERPNIIWVITEDISPELGCYGYEGVQTPNLDAFAKQAVRYTNTFVTGTVCSISRSALITGMYQTSIGAHNHRSHQDDGYILPAPVKPITDYLQDAGYYRVLAELTPNGMKKTTHLDFNFSWPNKYFDGDHWNQRKEGQPFFAELHISVTHRGPHWKTAVQQHQPQIDAAKVKLPPYYPDHPVAREDWATYLESIQLMDAYVGNFLKRLDQEGLSKNTVVMFFSDHGRCHVRDKQFLYEGGMRIPFLVRWPGHLRGGGTDDQLVSSIDISASTLKMAGIRPPAYMEGRPIIGGGGRKRDYIIAAKDRMDETVDKMRAVRTKRFKYIKNYYPDRPYMQPNKYKETEYPVWNLIKQLNAEHKLTAAQALFAAPVKPAEELYDIQTDPDELHNLARLPQHKKTLMHMRSILSRWIRETGDMGQFAEKEVAVSAQVNGR